MPGKSDIRAGGAFVELFVKGAKLEQGLNKFSSQLKSFGESAKAVGQKLATIGVAAGVTLGAAVKRFADFDDQMRAVAAASESTTSELDRLTATARKLGSSTSFTAVQVASLMTELGRAGFTATEVEKMTKAVLDLARATGTDATLASGIMAATIRQFGLDASQAGRVADTLTVAANKSFNSVEQLGEALSYAGPVAKDFNMSLEDTLAIFGGLGNIGIQASNAGTVVRRLLTTTGAEAEKLREIFGVTFKDAAGNARPLVDVLGEVNKATEALGTGDRAAKFNEAFGLLGITAASAIGGAVGDIKQLKTELDRAAGASAQTAARMDAGLGGSLRLIMTSIEGVALSIGTALAPMLQRISALVVDVAGKVKTWVDNNRELAIVLTGVVAGTTGLGFALIGLASAIGIAVIALKVMAAFIGGVIAVLSGPAGLVVAIGAAAAALTIGLAGAFIYASGIVPQLVSALAPLIDSIKTITAALVEGDFKKAWDVAATSVKYFGSVAIDVFNQLPDFAGHAAGKLSRAFVDAFSKVWDWIISNQTTVLSGMLKVASGFAPALMKAMFSGNFVEIAAQMAVGMKGVLAEVEKGAAEFGEKFSGSFGQGYLGMKGPTLDSSQRTNDLRDALKQMNLPVSKEGRAAAAASGAMAAVGMGISSAGSMTSRVLSQAGSVAQAPGNKPELDPSAIQKYRERIDELRTALAKHAITQSQFDTGVKQLRANMLEIADPVQEYRDRLELLGQALVDRTISSEEFLRETEAAKAALVDQTPLEKYMTRLKELKALVDGGIMDEKEFKTAQMEALPDKVKAIIERSKTPLQKFNEQITEARDFFSRGLITEGQFAKEQEKLQKEFRVASKQDVSVSFSSAALIAQGMGALGGSRDNVGSKLEEQISETKVQTDVLRKIDDKLGKQKKPTFS